MYECTLTYLKNKIFIKELAITLENFFYVLGDDVLNYTAKIFSDIYHILFIFPER